MWIDFLMVLVAVLPLFRTSNLPSKNSGMIPDPETELSSIPPPVQP